MNRLSRILFLLAATGAMLVAVPANASVIWDESVNGDLSNLGASPTPLALSSGSNLVLGLTGDQGQGTDRDYFSFNVPVGTVLSSIILLDNTTVAGSVSFIAIEVGSQITATPFGGNVQDLLGYGHYGNEQIGSNLLLPLVANLGSGLPSGAYSIWVQETAGPAPYGFDLVVTPVPLPAAAGLLFSGLVGLVARRRRALAPAAL
jgi:hypothetical protein